MMDKLTKLKQTALAEISKAKDLKELENIRVKYLGRKDGELTIVLRGISKLPSGQRKTVGGLANRVKRELEAALKEAEKKTKELKRKKVEYFDVTLPGKRPPEGHFSPITKIRMEVEDIFKSMGFEVYEGDEVTSDFYNFESLNIPKDHPARDIQDTFFIKDSPDLVMRTHTSAMQVKIMEKQEPPLRVIVPGRCFRREATDPSHEHTFYQLEGFLVDENVSIANLVYTQKVLLKQIFGREVKVRLRPGYFPFVEPGFELDCSCVICDGRGCSVCKNTGWVELIPCGMIHPKVFEFAGYPKNKFTGFAFGMGLNRLVMMKYKIDDIRLFISGDLRFLEQF
jgi:phenylalanyl-tRNA synthetase alpha chain